MNRDEFVENLNKAKIEDKERKQQEFLDFVEKSTGNTLYEIVDDILLKASNNYRTSEPLVIDYLFEYEVHKSEKLTGFQIFNREVENYHFKLISKELIKKRFLRSNIYNTKYQDRTKQYSAGNSVE